MASCARIILVNHYYHSCFIQYSVFFTNSYISDSSCLRCWTPFNAAINHARASVKFQDVSLLPESWTCSSSTTTNAKCHIKDADLCWNSVFIIEDVLTEQINETVETFLCNIPHQEIKRNVYKYAEEKQLFMHFS